MPETVVPENLKLPVAQPWYAHYYFRFEAVRDNGDRVTRFTCLTGLSATECSRKLWELLGGGRYAVSFLGITEIPMDQWSAEQRVRCNVNLQGRPIARAQTPPLTPGTPTGNGGGVDGSKPARPRPTELQA